MNPMLDPKCTFLLLCIMTFNLHCVWIWNLFPLWNQILWIILQDTFFWGGGNGIVSSEISYRISTGAESVLQICSPSQHVCNGVRQFRQSWVSVNNLPLLTTRYPELYFYRTCTTSLCRICCSQFGGKLFGFFGARIKKKKITSPHLARVKMLLLELLPSLCGARSGVFVLHKSSHFECNCSVPNRCLYGSTLFQP